MARTTEQLRQEHRLIERVLAALTCAADRLAADEAVDPAFWTGAVDFIRNYADRFHHAKEEELLFELYRQRGLPRDEGPVAVMLAEHDQGRLLVRALAESAALTEGGGESRRELAATAREFAALLAQHIRKEDEILYPMGEQLLTPRDQAELLAQFDRAAAALGGEATTARYQALAAKLAALAAGAGDSPQ